MRLRLRRLLRWLAAGSRTAGAVAAALVVTALPGVALADPPPDLDGSFRRARHGLPEDVQSGGAPPRAGRQRSRNS